MRRLALIGALALALTACAYGRSAADLRSTPIGRMAAPAGSALAAETYTPASFNIDGVQCAHLDRMYASNDAVAFLETMQRLIAGHREATYVRIPDRPVFLDDQPGYAEALAASTIEGTSVGVVFHDLDDPAYRRPPWIDAQAWRYVIDVHLYDEYEGQGGGCH